MIRSMMYLRPGNLLKDFIVEESKTDVSPTGRPALTYKDDGVKMLRGVLAEADPRQKRRWEQLQHPITHTIVQTGRPRAKERISWLWGTGYFWFKGWMMPGTLESAQSIMWKKGWM